MNRTLKTILGNTCIGSLVSVFALPLDFKDYLTLAIGITVLLELVESVIGSIISKLFKRP